MQRNNFFGGLGLRNVHYQYLLENSPKLSHFFEIISENYFETQGRPLAILENIRSRFQVACHGVGLGIGGPDKVSDLYLKRLKMLIDHVDPFIVSDHLCWTSKGGHYTHDLLPLPYTEETLRRCVEKVDQVQSYLGRQILLENPSSYLQFKNADFSEVDFLVELSQRSGCGILLDINNIFVTCSNFSWNPIPYLDKIPSKAIGQIHLAGFSDEGTHLFDTHSKQVDSRVWDLYQYKIRTLPNKIPVLIEWDDEIPEFPVLEAELKKANDLWHQEHLDVELPF